MPRYRIHPKVIARIVRAMSLTQAGFANLLNVRRETVNQWLNGSNKPNDKHYKHLTRLYDKLRHQDPPLIT